MANSFVNIHLHIVFAVKNRDGLLADIWRDELYNYIAGILTNIGYKPIAIGGYRDHVHMLIGCPSVIDIPSLVKNIKLATNQWIQPKVKFKFEWQRGYGCFSVSQTHIPALIEYIKNQPIHHSQVSMPDEFRRLFSVNGIKTNEEYFFEPTK